MRLLVAEDDSRLLKTLTHIFESNKFSVDGVSNGEDALAHGQTVEYDGMVLDIMMPGMDGISVLKTLREAGVTTPALFLTARSEVSQRVEGLDAGADDYLPKPFSTAELLARVRAMLRWKDNYLPDLLTLGPVTLNRSTYQLSCNGGEQTLSGKEFQLLEMMQTPAPSSPPSASSPICGAGTPMWTPASSGCTSQICAKRSTRWARRWRYALCGARAICWRCGHDRQPSEEVYPH